MGSNQNQKCSTRYSACSSIFDSDDPSTIFRRLSEPGYDAVELLGEPGQTDLFQVASLLKKTGLSFSALTASSRLAPDRDLASPDTNMLQRIVGHVQSCIEFASRPNCPVVGIALWALGHSWIEGKPEASNRWIGRACLPAAERSGVKLAGEALNRYVNPIVCTTASMLSFSHFYQSGVRSLANHLDVCQRICPFLSAIRANVTSGIVIVCKAQDESSVTERSNGVSSSILYMMQVVTPCLRWQRI
jgi:hypothetical protein